MKIIDGLKKIIFDPEEDETTKIPTVDGNTDTPIAEKIEPQKKEEVSYQREVVEEPPRRTTVSDTTRERDLFRVESSSPFDDFDEQEFINNMTTPKASTSSSKSNKPVTNVLEYERKRTEVKKTNRGIEKTEIVERKKFKPSPIISPVYGILNEDYRAEDIKSRTESDGSRDVTEVRNKAFASILNEEKKEEVPEVLYDETVTVKAREEEEIRKEKVKTIDELLEDTSDVIINTSDALEYDKIDEELEDLGIPNEDKVEPKVQDEDDTLENDLFDLIDSMYDNREDGED